MDVTPPLLQRATFGAYAATEPWPDLSAHYAMEAQLGTRLPVMSWFLGLEGGWPATQALMAAKSGHDLLLAWQPSHRDGTPIMFTEILSGAWDRRLDNFFTAAAAYPHQVVIRFAHEMNLSQLVQSIANRNPCTSDLNVWLTTWRYIVDRQRVVGGANVKWMFNVNSIDLGGVGTETYWPGADYVDILGIDAYNGYGPWTPPAGLIKTMYHRLTKLHPTAPVWLGEVGCRGVAIGESYSKADWWQLLLTSTEFPRLDHVIFFNANKERDWRVTTPDVITSMTASLQLAARTTIV